MDSINALIEIRSTELRDLPDLYNLFVQVNSTGGQFPWFESTSWDTFKNLWTNPENTSFVATLDGVIAGGYYIKPQWPGRGSHVATGVYMVSPAFRRRKIGYTLGLHSQEIAKKLGFKSMQYNLVVSKNESGLSLWKKLGFEIAGTLPNAYLHETHGFVDAYVMYRNL